MLFPQHEAAVAGAVPGRQWPEENNLMTQEYAEISTGRGGTSKLLLAVS
ncbi:putative inner membrane protein, partial [Salmonella enterica subsp. enterica serovar Wandsworth str. A4-580]